MGQNRTKEKPLYSISAPDHQSIVRTGRNKICLPTEVFYHLPSISGGDADFIRYSNRFSCSLVSWVSCGLSLNTFGEAI